MDNYREYEWNDTIQNESTFIPLPEGEYDFIVTSFTRGRHNGSANLPACPKAILKIKIAGADEVTLEHNLFLHSKCEGFLSAFFVSIGLKKEGEPLQMNWGEVEGRKGRCKLKVDNWTSNNGNAMQSNKIAKFLAPADKSFVPGQF